MLWTKTFGGTNDDVAILFSKLQMEDILLPDIHHSFGAGSDDVYLIKTDSSGNSGCNEGNPATIVTTPATIELNTTTIVTNPPTTVGSGGTVTTLCTTVGISPLSPGEGSGVRFSPNPFSNEINITSTDNELSEIILYDITSRKLLQQTFTNSTSINTSQLSKGIYFYEVRNKNGVIEKGKVIHR